MRIDIGVVVRGKEEKDVGRVARVVIDPDQKRVTHLVVETGFLFGRLIIVPLQAVRRANHYRLWLKITAAELKQMADFIQTDLAAPPKGYFPPLGYPPGGVVWPGGYIYVPMVVERGKRMPPGSIEVNHGTEVFALDGKIGRVGEVVVRPESGRILGFAVGKSRWLPGSVFLPLGWISAAGGGRLSLNRTKAQILAQQEDAARAYGA